MTYFPHMQQNAGVTKKPKKGFTLIELMIVLAIIAIILTLGLPVYINYTIRAKIGEGLGVAAAAKTAVGATCLEDPTLVNLDNNAAGYNYEPSTWVSDISVSGNCTTPVITILTQNTGASQDPEITLTGNIEEDPSVFTWLCASNAENYLLPSECRN